MVSLDCIGQSAGASPLQRRTHAKITCCADSVCHVTCLCAQVMWLSDGLPNTSQTAPCSSTPAPDTAPMPTIAEEEGSPDRHAAAASHQGDSQGNSPSQAAAGIDSEKGHPAAGSGCAAEPAARDLSSSFSFTPPLSLHPDQAALAAIPNFPVSGPPAPDPVQAMSLFAGPSSSSTEKLEQPEDSHSSALPLAQTSKDAGQGPKESMNHEWHPNSNSDGKTGAGRVTLKLPSLRQPCLEASLTGSWEGLENVGLEPLPSGGTSPDMATAPRSRLGPSSRGRDSHDDSLEGSHIPRLAFPGFSAGAQNESRDQGLTSSTPKFSPKQHFSLHDPRSSRAGADSLASSPQHLNLADSAEQPVGPSGRPSEPSLPEHTNDYVHSASHHVPMGHPSRLMERPRSTMSQHHRQSDINHLPSSQSFQQAGDGHADTLASQAGSPRQPGHPFWGIFGGGGDESPVGRRSLEARRESMLRALSGSSRSSSGDLSGSFSGSLQPQHSGAEPPAVGPLAGIAPPPSRSSSSFGRQQVKFFTNHVVPTRG